MSKKDDVSQHWEAYYRSKNVPSIPSQFAVFVLNEIQPSAVVDIGCGSGRDTFYFSTMHIPTIGIDGSESAIALCNDRGKKVENLNFQKIDINDPQLADRAADLLREQGVAGHILVYARFFVHAIDEVGEIALLNHARRLLDSFGGMLAVEFRTTRDRSMEKATPDHYRRFVNPLEFTANASGAGLTVVYNVEGFGMAKYREDDAYVARMLLKCT